MRDNLTPSSENAILALRGEAARLLDKAPSSGFNERDCATLSKLIDRTRRFFGYSSYARMAGEIGVSSRVLISRAKHPEWAPSLFNYQRTLNGLLRIYDQALDADSAELPEAAAGRATEWRAVPKSLHHNVIAVGELLTEILEHIRGINDPALFDDVLQPLDRAQLIAVLETTLAILKAPLVEVGLLRRTARCLIRLGKQVADKGVGIALGALADKGGAALIKLIMGLKF